MISCTISPGQAASREAGPLGSAKNLGAGDKLDFIAEC